MAAAWRGCRAAGQQLWQRYGLPDFVADLRQFLAEPDGVLLAAAQRRLAARAPGSQPLLHRAGSASALPIELSRLLAGHPSTQPLLLQISDPAPLPLLEARWRAPLQLAQRLLAGRPWALSCRSPILEQQVESPLAQRWATTTNT